MLDEHPSAARWPPAERAAAIGWIALLIDRFGDAGVQRLVAALAR